MGNTKEQDDKMIFKELMSKTLLKSGENMDMQRDGQLHIGDQVYQ